MKTDEHKMWNEIKTAPANEIVLVCNPREGEIPVVAKRIASQWYNIGAIPVGYSPGQHPHLHPAPTHWMRWPDMPAISDDQNDVPIKSGAYDDGKTR